MLAQLDHAEQELFPVSLEQCNACCEYACAELPGLNPVVASLVYAAVASTPMGPEVGVPNRIRQQQLCEFAQARLASGEALQNQSTRLDQAIAEARSGKKLSVGRSLTTWLTERFRQSKVRIGLAGVNSRFGLGNQNRDLCCWLPAESWLAPFSRSVMPARSNDDSGTSTYQFKQTSWDASPGELVAWLGDLDAVIFIERPPFMHLIRAARQSQTKVVCVPNWEWIRPGMDWVSDVDLMLCPTQFTFELCTRWKQQFEFEWEIEFAPWPIDVEYFPFRQRQVCRRFVSVIGNGGFPAKVIDEEQSVVHRKGLDVLLAAAMKLPECEFIIYTNRSGKSPLANVEFRKFVANRRDLYREGDVCVQCSYWEGLGLPLLECQAAGMPLVTTDRAPMNEHNPLALIPVRDECVGSLGDGQWIAVPKIAADDVASVLRSLHGQPIDQASFKARDFVGSTHSWDRSRHAIRKRIECLAREF